MPACERISNAAAPLSLHPHTCRRIPHTLPALLAPLPALPLRHRTPCDARQGRRCELAHRLDAINRLGAQPWELSFSFGRALQAPVLHAWAGDEANRQAAQDALLERARLNGAARQGRYDAHVEQ